jgi:hypothetical protein
MNFQPLRTLVLVSSLALAGGVQAATMTTVPDALGNFTVTDTTGPAAPETFNFNVTPTSAPIPVWFSDTNNPPGNQSPANIAAQMAAVYGTDASKLVLTAACDDIVGPCQPFVHPSANVFNVTNAPKFDYLALHFGGGELFFHWAQPLQSMTLTAFNGFPGALSNYRAYLTTPVPGALLLFLSALGFLGLGRKLVRPADGEPTPA